MIDFHCHIDLYEEPQRVINEIKRRDCDVLAVTTTPLAWEGTLALVGGAARIKVAVGIHPEIASTRHREVDHLKELLPETRYVGEIGLDGSKPHQASLDLQSEVFDLVLSACESVGGRVMTIHSRGATSLVLDHLEAHPGAGLPVLHWFSGTVGELQRAIEMGCWFSLGPAMLRGTKGRRLVSAMPIDRILTESDGPLARRRGKPLMPWDVHEAEVVLGKLLDLPVIAVQRQLSLNLGHVSGHGSKGILPDDSMESKGFRANTARPQTFHKSMSG